MASAPPSDFAQKSWPNLRIKTGFHPGDDVLGFTDPKIIHKFVVHYLSCNEPQDFNNMTPNKIAVVGLYYETLRDYLPKTGSTTYQLFGYAKLHELDHPCLLGLYQGLIRHLDCPVQEFLQAYENGQLYSLIKSKFSGIPEGSRGGYYLWFRERRELFDGLKPTAESSQCGTASEIKICQVCNESTTTRCGRCKKVWYCTREHQKADWKDHKGACSNA